MNSATEMIVYWSSKVNVYDESAKEAIKARDGFIYSAYIAGERQAAIAMYAGLSPSTVKHIIAKQRKKCV